MTVWTAWERRHLWPQMDPRGYLFLGYAFDAAGGAIFPNWSGHEVEDAAKDAPVRLPTAEQAYIGERPHYGFHKRYGPQIRALCGITDGEDIPPAAWRAVADDQLTHWQKVIEARWRRDEVIRQLSALARSGELRFASRRKGGGQEPKPIKPEAWELDHPWVPFATLGCDDRMGLASSAPTSWLFVDATSLAHCLGQSAPPSSAASYLLEVAAEEDAARYLFEEGEWISASRALTLVDKAESLERYAGNDDGENPLLRTRCKVLDAKTKDGRESRQRVALHTWFWSNLLSVTSDWQVGLFVRRDPETGTEFTASCVEFSLTDINRLRGLTDDQRELDVAKLQSAVATVQLAKVFDRPSLPSSAKPSDRRHEEFAHNAAEKVRHEGLTPQAAFRAVAPEDKTRDADSILRAIRSAYDLMYDRTGHAIKN